MTKADEAEQHLLHALVEADAMVTKLRSIEGALAGIEDIDELRDIARVLAMGAVEVALANKKLSATALALQARLAGGLTVH